MNPLCGAANDADPIRVGIIEDQIALRDSILSALEQAEGITCVGAFPNMESALAGLPLDPLRVLLIDLALPGMHNVEGIRKFRIRWPRASLLTLALQEEDRYVLDALCIGADGCLQKYTTPEDLIKSIREAVNGGAPISPSIARALIHVFREKRYGPESDMHLTPREYRILRLLAGGEDYEGCAKALNLQAHTISQHVRNIYGKLRLLSHGEALRKSRRTSFVS